jgi:hypothetical protein
MSALDASTGNSRRKFRSDTLEGHADTGLGESATIANFSTSQGDKIDIANGISGYDPIHDASQISRSSLPVARIRC